MKFVIARDGAVSSVMDSDSTLADGQVRMCIKNVFYALSFPHPEGGGVVTVVYPIALAAE